jgi:Protein of unknown function (DUF2630)
MRKCTKRSSNLSARSTSCGIARQPATADRQRLEQLKVSLDQCWDLPRQRRALSQYGRDPDNAIVRSEDVVEGYRQ